MLEYSARDIGITVLTNSSRQSMAALSEPALLSTRHLRLDGVEVLFSLVCHDGIEASYSLSVTTYPESRKWE